MSVNKTVRVTFSDSVMMFGNSYKPWEMQFREYILYQKKPIELIKVETSHSKWVSWGGLKWCPEERFQQQLNREGCQGNELDNPKPRQYSEMNFNDDAKAFKKASALMDECKECMGRWL